MERKDHRFMVVILVRESMLRLLDVLDEVQTQATFFLRVNGAERSLTVGT